MSEPKSELPDKVLVDTWLGTIASASAELSARMRAREFLFASYATIAVAFYGATFREGIEFFENVVILGSLLGLIFLSAILHHHHVINRIWVFLAVNMDQRLKRIDTELDTVDRFLYRDPVDYTETRVKMVFYVAVFLFPMLLAICVRAYSYFIDDTIAAFGESTGWNLLSLFLEALIALVVALLLKRSFGIVETAKRQIARYATDSS